MRLRSKLLLASLGMLAVTGAAAAAGQKLHVLSVRLPDGSVQHVRYAGDVPPRLIFVPVARPQMPNLSVGERFADPFLSFDRMFEEMNRRAEAMLRQAAAMAARTPVSPGQITSASTRSMPPGTVQFSSFSVVTPRGTCSRTVQISSQGEGRPAKVVSQTSGDCGASASAPQKPERSGKKGATAAPTAAAPPTDARDTI